MQLNENGGAHKNASLDGAGQAGSAIAAFSIRRPVTVCMVFVCLTAMGLIAGTRIPLVMLPDVTFPGLFIWASYPNATPQQVQETITRPIEEAVAVIPGIQRITSYSGADGGEVSIFFKWGQDIDFLRAEVREKIDRIQNELPDDLRRISIRKFSTEDQPVMFVSLAADRELSSEYDFLDVKLKKPLERIPGVAEVELYGVLRHQLDIYLRLDDLKRYKIDVTDLFRRLDEANLNVSLGPVSDGQVRLGAVSRGVLRSIDDVRDFPINERGLVLSDVAFIDFDNPNVVSGRRLNGQRSIGFAVRKASQANTVDTLARVREVLDGLEGDPSFSGIQMRVWHDASEEIVKSLTGLLESGVVGALLAVLVLFVFLRRLNASLVVGFAIPFSIVGALGFIYFAGATLNILTMMGLMLSTGMLVDNAVVVLESIYQKLEKGYERERATTEGSGEVTTAVIAATLTSVIIFVPLIFGQATEMTIFFGQAGLAIVFALFCSLFISLTLIPIAVGRILDIDPHHRAAWQDKLAAVAEPLIRRLGRALKWGEAPEGGRITETYLRLVQWPLRRRFLTGFVLAPLLVYGAVWVMNEKVKTNSPEASEISSLGIDYDFTENYHYAKIEVDYVDPVEQYLEENREKFKIRDYESSYRNNNAYTRVYFDEDALTVEEVTEIRKEIGENLPVIPGAEIKTGGQNSGGARNHFDASIFGEDPAVLTQVAKDIMERLLEQEGFDEAWVGRDDAAEEVQVRLNRGLARRYGISPEAVSGVLGIAVRARQMRSFRTDDGEVEMWIRLDQADLEDLNDLKSIIVGAGTDGKPIELEQVAEFNIEKVPGRLRREDRRTYTYVTGVYTGDKKEDGKALFEEVLRDYPFPDGYGWSYGFWTQRQDAENADMLFNFLLALFMVYFVMSSLFESLLQPFAIMVSLPFAVVGVAGMLWITDTPFNVMAQIGSVILVGIVVNNGIVLIDHINNLRRRGFDRTAAVIEGCRERFRPIVMTAATTIVGLAPLALGGSSLGPMRYFPMARTVMGGLIASTILTLIVLPTYYTLLDDLGRWFQWLVRSTSPRRPQEQPAGD